MRPEARKSSTSVGFWSRSSPRTTPAKRARWSCDRERVPRRSTRRNALAITDAGPPPSTRRAVVIRRRPAMCREASRTRCTSSSAEYLPATRHRSPAAASCSAATDDGAVARRRIPSMRRSTRVPPGIDSGSPTSVATPSMRLAGATSTGDKPSHARAASHPETTNPAASTTAAARRPPPRLRIAATTAAATSGNGPAHFTQAPAPTATASATTRRSLTYTLTRRRRAESFASPIPRTSSSSSTDRNRPLSCR